jgi:arylamine N-acetyltransferase
MSESLIWEKVKMKIMATKVNDILNYLECPRAVPTLRYLNRLIHAYVRKVPWESVSRIVKRHTTLETKDCPRWPEEFWSDAIQYGFGGTCFESSLAFYGLLTSLGYEGYLTVNEMGTSIACHAAIVIIIHGQKYLVDITIPLHSAIEFTPDKITRRKTTFHNYTVRPIRPDIYDVERSHHSQKYAFTLIDIPVSLSEYGSILEKDYTQKGYFLNSVVMAKIIDDKFWRFFSDHQPYRMESFDRKGKREILLSPETFTQDLADKFQLPEDKILAALSGIQTPVEPYEVLRPSRVFALELRAG